MQEDKGGVIDKYINQIIEGDCLDIMKGLPDKCIDLVLTDPPYGIKESKGKNKSRSCLVISKDYGNSDWDNETPKQAMFDEMHRISKNQILWGGNYFNVSPSPSWLVWDKQNGENDFADCELAWTSFKSAVRIFRFRWQGMLQGDMKNKTIRIHPTEKPVQLFQWCLDNYSEENDLILDCFSGSGTTAIACHRMNRRFICIEKEHDYVIKSRQRLKDEQSQLNLFRDQPHESLKGANPHESKSSKGPEEVS